MRAGLLPVARNRLKQFRALCMAPEVQERIAAILQAAIAADPDDAGAWERLGDVRRRLRDFPAACEAYHRLRALRPDGRSAAWLHAISAGDRIADGAAGGSLPGGAVRAHSELPDARRGGAPADLGVCQARSFRSRDDMKGANPRNRRRTMDLSKRRGLATVSGACKEFSWWFVPKLRAVLPDVLTTLRCEDLFAGVEFNLIATAYLDAGFGLPHHDFESPLVGFYPGSYTHEITTVASGTDDFAAGRFAVSIFMLPAGAGCE